MKHILENLKLFYINHGGQASDLDGCVRIHQVLKKIASLPLGGGSDEFVVEFFISEDQSGMDAGRTRLETETPPQEIIEAHNQGKKIKAIIPGVDDFEGLRFLLDNIFITNVEGSGFMWCASNVIAMDGAAHYYALVCQIAEEQGAYTYEAMSFDTSSLIFEDNPYAPMYVNYTLNAATGNIYCNNLASDIANAYENNTPIVAKLTIEPTSTLKMVSDLTIGSIVYNKSAQGALTSVDIVYNIINYVGENNDATYMSVVHTHDYTTNQDSFQYYDKKFTVSSNS